MLRLVFSYRLRLSGEIQSAVTETKVRILAICRVVHVLKRSVHVSKRGVLYTYERPFCWLFLLAFFAAESSLFECTSQLPSKLIASLAH